MIEKPKLFLTLKEFWLVVLFFLFLFSIRLSFIYVEYRDFVQKEFYFTHVEVLQAYKKEKNGKVYTILRVHSPELDLNFFTRTYKENNFLGHRLRLKLFPYKKMTFWGYLGTSFIASKINAIYPPSKNLKSLLLEKISVQHQNPQISNFYYAIFLATPLDKKLRNQVSLLGVSHLIALSGFHIGILWGVLFFLFRPLYRLVQQRYFPYRFDVIDVGLFVLVLLGSYVWFVDSPASLLRSYTMMVMGWGVLIFGMELLSFTFIATMIMVLLLLFPKMLLSLAFWFSVMGVFYIFLLVERFKTLNKLMMMLLISFGIFVLMLPIAHLIFPVTTTLQFFSPFLSLAFTPFYPLSILAHLVGYGGVFDDLLLSLFSLESKSWSVKLEMIYGVVYLILSFGAIYSRWLFYLLFMVAIGFMGWMFFGASNC
jgi:competence protein ComEC